MSFYLLKKEEVNWDPDGERVKVYKAVKELEGGITRRGITDVTMLPISHVCGRVKELLSKGWLDEIKREREDNLLVIGERECPI
ncbi:hypothetical protein GF336_00200 [Candidatus Woesearchaeota archaeon]|nr:hypothetical protein [Candidatus Woesearchaeota archaeon]